MRLCQAGGRRRAPTLKPVGSSVRIVWCRRAGGAAFLATADSEQAAAQRVKCASPSPPVESLPAAAPHHAGVRSPAPDKSCPTPRPPRCQTRGNRARLRRLCTHGPRQRDQVANVRSTRLGRRAPLPRNRPAPRTRRMSRVAAYSNEITAQPPSVRARVVSDLAHRPTRRASFDTAAEMWPAQDER
jgi:hypothetical protein